MIISVTGLVVSLLVSAAPPIVTLTQDSAAPGVSEVDPKDPEQNFDHLWHALDRGYAGFQARHVDWDALYEVYRPQVTAETSEDELFDVMLGLIQHLNDSHVCINDGSRRVCSGFIEEMTMDDFSRQLVRTVYLSEPKAALGGNITYGWLTDTIAYIHILDFKQGREPSTAALDTVLTELADAEALVVDVRADTGGNVITANRMASRFADRKRHYSTSWSRYGVNHGDFAPARYWNVEPRGAVQFTGPTILLTHRFTESAAEEFTLAMRVLPHVTVVGDATGGACSSYFPQELPNGWTLTVAWVLSLDQEGHGWNGIGIPPDLRKINTKADIDAQQDRVLEFAIELLGTDSLVPQDESSSLVNVMTSLVEEYGKNVAAHDVEAAIAMLRGDLEKENHYFSVDEVFSDSMRYMERGEYDELIALMEFGRELYPEGAYFYGMLAFAYLQSGDEAAARAVLRECESVTPMYPWEVANIERARAALAR